MGFSILLTVRYNSSICYLNDGKKHTMLTLELDLWQQWRSTSTLDSLLDSKTDLRLRGSIFGLMSCYKAQSVPPPRDGRRIIGSNSPLPRWAEGLCRRMFRPSQTVGPMYKEVYVDLMSGRMALQHFSSVWGSSYSTSMGLLATQSAGI